MKKFNLRVYGILINEFNQVLVSDEMRQGIKFTKFPGGGLEWGEGLHDALRREFMEELGISIQVNELFYVNDFFQQSAFHLDDQIVSFYFLVYANDLEKIKCTNLPFFENERENHRWISLRELNENAVSFPIDKVVACKLNALSDFSNGQVVS